VIPWRVVSERELSAAIPGGAPIVVKIVADSITYDGSRLVTWCWEYQRIIHAEIMTHRALSRNAASSRAIPAKKLRQRVLDAPAMPVHWGQNQAGMQASTEVADVDAARQWWLEGRNMMAAHHERGEALGLHKQIVNRVIEPWMTIAVVVSMTDHANLFHLRKHKDAEPNFQVIATLAWELFHNHMPTYLPSGEWHLPYITPEDHAEVRTKTDAAFIVDDLKKISTGRCARVSYLTHEGKRDIAEDIALHDKLANTASLGADPMHASPFEHPAKAVGGRQRFGNFEGWMQYRKFFKHENGPDTTVRCDACGCWGGRHVNGCVEQRIEKWA
jgi:hypothetical protein